ncbi:MAG: lipid-binding SYLF domain-containing protein [Salibacteraceae bacterium]|jgi:lipid-binding SYLF domain-containing protein
MKIKIITILSLMVFNITSQTVTAQLKELEPDIVKKSTEGLRLMIKEAPELKYYYHNSFGYAVFPKVTKLGITLGGALGKGVVFKNHEVVSASKLKQVTLGSQFGIQQYSEVIFFLNEKAFDKFMSEKLKIGGQASAVVLTSGVSADMPYSYGVAVFTQPIGGLMFEASIGIQCFTNKPIRF